MIIAERWSGESRKFIGADEIVRVLGTRMGGDKIPAGGGSGGFQFETCREMFLQVSIVFRSPLDAPP